MFNHIMHEYKELTAVKMVTLCIAIVVLLLVVVIVSNTTIEG